MLPQGGSVLLQVRALAKKENSVLVVGFEAEAIRGF